MDRHEEAVMNFLTANGETFVLPEPDLGSGWSSPDFIAIRPAKKTAYVVEVTASGHPVSLLERINNREDQWLRLLRDHLQKVGVSDSGWSYRVLAFVRRDQCDWVCQCIKDDSDVRVICLEEASASWEWPERVWTFDFSFETDELTHGIR